LHKNLRPLSRQKPKFIGATSRFLFSLREAPDDSLYFDIKKKEHPEYIVLGAGTALGIKQGTTFGIRVLSDDIGSLVVQSVTTSECRAHAQLRNNNSDPIPPTARAILHNWSLYDAPLKVAVGKGAPPLHNTDPVHVVNRSSEADIVISKHKDHLELARSTLIPDIPSLKLDKITNSQSLQSILTQVAQFNYHLLRQSPDPLDDVTVELYRVYQNGNRLYPENDNLLVDGELKAKADDLYGILVKNNSQYELYPNIFVFDPSDYSVTVSILINVIACGGVFLHLCDLPGRASLFKYQ
jgi:hypothetical protein